MTATFAFVLILVALALLFDYINGFHDAANSIATVVSTRVLSPGVAVIWAAFFNFIAFAIFGTRVAKAIGDGVRMDLISADLRLYVLMCALLGAIIWNLVTWYLGLPTSSSHSLLGGYAGAGIAAFGGIHALLKTEVWVRTIKFIVLTPLIGMLLGFVLMVAVHWIFRRATPKAVDKFFRKGQLFSAAAIALGTLSGGWRIVHTMGSKITKLRPIGGFCAETGAAITLAYVTLTGTPVSTTHTITGAIVGVGATRRLSAVKWGIAGRIVWAWVLTIPAAGIIAAISFGLVRLVLHLSS